MRRECEVAVVGAGPAGLTAGIYAGRAGLSVVIFEKVYPGGQLATTDTIENFPGIIEPVGGLDLAERMKVQAVKYGAEIEQEEVIGIENSEDPDDRKIVRAKDSSILAMSVIIATGASPRKLGVPGEERFWGRGMSSCATCDGRFYKDKEVVVVGGGEAAVKGSLFLTRFASKITLVHRRGRLRASQFLQKRLFAVSDKVNLRWNSVVTEILGEQKVEAVSIRDLNTEETDVIHCDGVFVFVGLTPNSVFLRNYLKTDDAGYIITDENMATSVKGVFACGDVRKKLLRQVVTACGDGATAAFAAQQYVEGKKGIAYR